MHRIRIGVDLGGTKIEVAALDARNQTVLRKRVATPKGDYGATVEAIATLIEESWLEVGNDAPVGIGTPGSASPRSGRIRNANSTVLNGKTLQLDLERRLAHTVRMSNDANCFTLSEAVDGAASDARVVFGIILGTGVGGGISVAGSVLPGANAIAGEWGHAQLPWASPEELAGRECYCGKIGCIETFLSGPSFSRDYAMLTSHPLAPTEIEVRALAGETQAQRALEVYLDRLARGLAMLLNILDPDTIVFGGGVSKLNSIYAGLQQRIGAYVFSDTVRTAFVAARYGDSSGVRGAAMLWP